MQISQESNKRVAYFYNSQIGKFHYGKEHPMKPKRIAMAHNLIVNYGLYRNLDVYVSREASLKELDRFHDKEYIEYLSQFISTQKSTIIRDIQQYSNQTETEFNQQINNISSSILAEFDLLNYNKVPLTCSNQTENHTNINQGATINPYRVGDTSDCPSFPGLFTFCQLSTGASIDCAHTILCDQTDIAINWSGGLHHAKKREASGFCYVNDIVICILELLRGYSRVLYVDIDVHHGDGVEEAFFLTNRVMTVSFHQYGDEFYPGSGNIESIGEGIGRYHSINVPLKPGMNDETFIQLFKQVVSKTMEVYRPNAVVLQCGADSLSLDKLGGFNLSIKGHGECLEYIKTFNQPLIVLGGGGYTIQNVARCWAYETGLCLGQKIDQPIPTSDIYYEHYSPDYRLHYPIKNNVENKNKKEDLHKIVEQVTEYLKRIESAPGIQIHEVPYSFYPQIDQDSDDLDPDINPEMSLKKYEGPNRLDDQMGQEINVDIGRGYLIHKNEHN